jgi:hypothetical protein
MKAVPHRMNAVRKPKTFGVRRERINEILPHSRFL